MKIYQKIALAGMMAAPAALLSVPAGAQVAGMAVSDPSAAILSARALGAANTQISTTYKSQLDQAQARQAALRAQITTLTAPLDTNGDKQISEAEIAAAQAAKNPAIARIQQAQQVGEADLARLNAPAYRAQAYAIEQIGQKYNDAVSTVARSKNVNIVLSPNSVQYAPPASDITAAVTAEIDRVLPTVTIAPPANWQPSQDTVALQRQFQQIAFYQAQRQQAAAGAPGAPAAPAAGKKQPSGR